MVNSAYSCAFAATYALVLDGSSSNPCKLHKKDKNKVRINRKRKRKIIEMQDGSSFLNHYVYFFSFRLSEKFLSSHNFCFILLYRIYKCDPFRSISITMFVHNSIN